MIVGGMLLSPICSLLVIPVLTRIFLPERVAGTGESVVPQPAE